MVDRGLELAARRVRRIGMGIMGLGDMMYRLGVRYGSEDGQEFASQVMEFVHFHAMRQSVELAKTRGSFLAIQGSSRRPQMALAEDFGLADYPCPAGGCLLTDPGFARRMRDLVRFHPEFDLNSVNLLKVGRHFRLSAKTKVAVGRNEAENRRLQHLARCGDSLFEVQGCGSPVTLLRGEAGATVGIE